MRCKLAVIGSPIKHTLSPFIHKNALLRLGIECDYEVHEVKKDNVFEFVKYAKNSGICGFNITMPLKCDIIKYLDEIDPSAELCGAVNTVAVKSGRLKGYNTDGEGYKKSVEEKGFCFDNKNIVFIGAGGAALSVSVCAAKAGAKQITVINRSLERAKELCGFIKEKTGLSAVAAGFDEKNLNKSAQTADLLINATPLGMSSVSEDFEDLSFLNNLKKDAFVSDFIYNPFKTKLLSYAENRGLKTVNGLGMLIYQGVIADGIYLEKDLDFKALKDFVENEYKKLR